ncbi:MAG: hypothetical protein KatS3mg115_0273 [Candidatus Poribacteria bacterium]|nr:MAG: hypothetical protein KatS3mg115_0273 [Candidatus Poribacteria bacterium]
MLQEARRRADALPNRERERLAWVQADLRRLRLSRRFDRVLLPLGTWESLLTPEDQLQALRVVRAHLSPAGLAFLDLSDLSPEELIGEPVRGTAPLFFLSESLAPNGEREETLALFFTRRLDLDRQWRIEEYTLERFDRGGKLRGRLHVPRIRRWSHRYEMEHLFARAGLEPVELLGDFSSGPFAAGGRQIWTLRIVEPTG